VAARQPPDILCERRKTLITKKETELSVAQADEIATAGVSRDNSLLYFTVASKESDIWLLDASAENE
jgi:hypothetical protein